MELRDWQSKAVAKALSWLVENETDRHFLINAAPGAGKTIAACVIAKRLLDGGLIDRVVVIAPRVEVVRQWAKDFHQVVGRYMGKINPPVHEIEYDICATWAAIEGLKDAFQAVCQTSRVLVICDEHHHAAVSAAWGGSADSAFSNAKYVVVLTGTPIRSDQKASVWLAYDDQGAINHPEDGTYTLTYGEAVDLGYCRPATFHRHEGRFTIDLEGGEHVVVTSAHEAELSPTLKRIPGLQRALNFYRLACTPLFDADKHTPRVDGYQGTMVHWASEKIDDLRYRMPNAGGLVIAPTIEMAEYMVKLIERMEGETPILVHSQMQNAEGRIEAFRHTDKRWLVSVAMISEGVDIPRLRVLIYLSGALTELAFRQAIGRVVRTNGPGDDTRAYVVIPSFEVLEVFARRVEEEMSGTAKKETGRPKTKRCPSCTTEWPISAKSCELCGFEFPKAQPKFKSCPTCENFNPISAIVCENCGANFQANFVLSLDDALRAGAIVRGMDIDEVDVKEGEEMAEAFREVVLASGDQKLVKLIKVLPEESWARLKRLLNEGS